MLKRHTPLRAGKSLKRGGPLARKTRLRQKRAKPRRSSRKIDKAHLAFVRTLPCCVCCRRPPSDPHHETARRGLGQKSDDDRTIPLCREHHDHAQNARGRFKGWCKDTMRAWHSAEVEKVMAMKEALKPPTVKQRLRIKLDLTIEHLTSEPGCTAALDAFSFAGAVRRALLDAGVIQEPAVVAPGAYRVISTTQEPAA